MGGWVQSLRGPPPKDSENVHHGVKVMRLGQWGRGKRGRREGEKGENAADKYSGGSSVAVSHAHTLHTLCDRAFPEATDELTAQW